MSQQEVIEVLKKSNKPLTIHEIAETLNVHYQLVQRSLVRMRKAGELDVTRNKDGRNLYRLRK